MTGWWFQPLWKIQQSVGMMIFPYGKISQSCSRKTTNQMKSPFSDEDPWGPFSCIPSGPSSRGTLSPSPDLRWPLLLGWLHPSSPERPVWTLYQRPHLRGRIRWSSWFTIEIWYRSIAITFFESTIWLIWWFHMAMENQWKFPTKGESNGKIIIGGAFSMVLLNIYIYK